MISYRSIFFVSNNKPMKKERSVSRGNWKRANEKNLRHILRHKKYSEHYVKQLFVVKNYSLYSNFFS